MVKGKKKKKSVKVPKLSIKKYPFTLIISIAALLLSLFVFINEAQKNQEQRSRAQVTNCDVTPTDLAIAAEEQQMLQLINAYRQENGAPPLTLSTNLGRMAAWLSNDMATKNYLKHDDSLGRDPFQRAADCGTPYGAENIGNGSESPTVILGQWKESPSHKTNILDPKYTVTGIARSGQFWTQVFAPEDTALATPMPTAAVSPTSPVPSPECLGSCPTIAPIVTTAPTSSISITNSPTPEVTQPVGTNPSVTPVVPTEPPVQNPGEDGGGFFELILAFLKLFLEFLSSLFK